MNPNTRKLHDLGQSLWLDNISRDMLRDGRLKRYIDEYAISGLTSNPTIFEKAIGQGTAYDESIARLARGGGTVEDVFFALALEDLREAARLFEPVHARTGGVDGWVSLELSPLLVDDTAGSIEAAAKLHEQAACRNLFIKIPGTPAGVPAIEESIFRGVPINVTLLFSREQTMAAAEAYLRGIERRLEKGLSPVVESVLSLFVSRWDVAVKDEVVPPARNRLGIAVAMRTYRAWLELLDSDRWKRLAASGAHVQRMLWASTGTKDPEASPTLYVEALAAPGTIDTLPDKTLEAFAAKGRVAATMPADGGTADVVMEEFLRAGLDLDALAARLQREGGEAFTKSWNALMGGLQDKMARLAGGVRAVSPVAH
jgi:transaldolase